MPRPETHPFTAEEVERSRRYHRPRYVALGLDVVIGLATLAVLAAAVEWRVGPWWLAVGYWLVIVPADYLMSRQMMRGLRMRAEGWA